MQFQEKIVEGKGIKITIHEGDQEVARARLYLLHNDLHEKPFAFLEDVYVNEEFRGKGYGKIIVQKTLEVAKREGAYKIIGTSRYARETVHSFYLKLGFEDYGKEFRLNLE